MTYTESREVEKVRLITEGIEDRISDAVCEHLYKLAKDVPKGQAIVEIGRGSGKSATWLVSGSQAGKKNRVFSFASQKDGIDPANFDSITGLVRNGIENTLELRHEATEDTALRWRGDIGLLWVNASNEYEDIKRVIATWRCHLSKHARVAIHGCDQPGISRVIREITGSLGNFTYEQTIDTTAVLAIDGCIHYWIINSEEIGICRYCGRERNFKRLTRETLETQTRRRQASRKGK